MSIYFMEEKDCILMGKTYVISIMGRKPIEMPTDRPLTDREKNRLAVREYQARNREKLRAKSRQYREDHPEYFKQKKKEEQERIKTDPVAKADAEKVKRRTYKKHRLQRIADSKAYADAHVEELKEYRKKNSARRSATSKAWKKANWERHKASRKKWENENRHVIRMHIALRRAREINATIGDPREIAAWEKGWKANPTNVCEWCRMETPTEFCQTDHAEPLTNGGAHNLDNLVIACQPCNNRKKDKPLAKWLEILGRDTSTPPTP